MQDYQITIPANLFFIPGGVSASGVPNNFNIDLWAGYTATSFVLFIIISNAIPQTSTSFWKIHDRSLFTRKVIAQISLPVLLII
ncbi:unnamed protein product [Rhizophagus irregularis]|nr:unnamed protein product [Rhizophagus irregularis]